MMRKLFLPGFIVVTALAAPNATFASEEGCRFVPCIQDLDW